MAGTLPLDPPAESAVTPVKTRGRRTVETLLLRPAAISGWELWNTDAVPRETGRFETVPDLEKLGVRTVGLPADRVLVISRWVQTTDDSVLPGMVDILLDRQGLTPKELGGKSHASSIVLKEDSRTLIAVRLLSGRVPDDLCEPEVARFELSADLQPLTRNGLTLWREAGRLVAAFSRDGALVHLQSFHEGVLNQSIAIEILCTLLQLETEEILQSRPEILLIGDFAPEEISLLGAILGNTPRMASAAAPVLPAQASGLTPPQVESQRLKRRNRQRLERIAMTVAAVYALIIFALVANVAWLTFRNQGLRKKIAADAPLVQTIRTTEARWRAMEPAINPAIYPVEVLFQSASLLPEDGVRFTLFEENDSNVLIRGEANSAAAAFKLAEAIKGQIRA